MKMRLSPNLSKRNKIRGQVLQSHGKNVAESPWLTPKEAADYCKFSLSLFNQKRRKIPICAGGTKRRTRFHREELDRWMRRISEVDNQAEMVQKAVIKDLKEEDDRLGGHPIRAKETRCRYKVSLLS